MTPNTPPKETQGTCPKCGPDRFAKVLAEEYTPIDHEDIHGGTDYRMLQCGGCKTYYFQTEFWYSEEPEERHFQNWPEHNSRPAPGWLDDICRKDKALHSLLKEVYSAAQHGLRVCAATAIRTAFDRAAHMLGIDPGYGFEEKLDELEKAGFLASMDRAVFDSMVDAGSAAAHRGWTPEEDELQMLIAALESFVHRSFILRDAVQKIGTGVPPRPPRPKKKSKIQTAIDPQNIRSRNASATP
jgi:hypothetical protein